MKRSEQTLALGALVAGLLAGIPAAAADPAAILRVAVVKAAARAELRVAIKNEGTATLWVNGLLNVEEQTCRPASRVSVRVVMIDKRNRIIHASCQANPVPPAREHYRVLAPGREVVSTVPLDCWNFEPGEAVRIEASYWDPAELTPPAPAGAVHLKDRLHASPITFVAP